jgi:anti-sigma-K factor RskA
MNWHRSPKALDHLASAYALGTLAGPARRRFEAVMRTHPHVARAAAEWEVRLHPMSQRLEPLNPSKVLWDRIEQRAFGGASGRAASAAAPLPWWRRLLAPIPAGALAMGLMLGAVLPSLLLPASDELADTQLPASYVGVLATADGRTGLIVSSLRQGKVMDVKQVQPVEVPAGQTLFLWVIDAKGAARAIGAVPQGNFVQVNLPQPSEALFATAVELAVSVEPVGSMPAAPSGAYVYRGLCGKLWRVKVP